MTYSQDWNFRNTGENLSLLPGLKITDITGLYNRGAVGPRFFLDSFSHKPVWRGKNDYQLRGVDNDKYNGIWVKGQCAKYDHKRSDNLIPKKLGFITVTKNPNPDSRRTLEIYLNSIPDLSLRGEIIGNLRRKFHNPVVYKVDDKGQSYMNFANVA